MKDKVLITIMKRYIEKVKALTAFSLPSHRYGHQKAETLKFEALWKKL